MGFSVTFFIFLANQPGGQTPQPIFTQNGLIDVDSRKDVPNAVTRNTLDCDQSNVYSSRDISPLLLHICPSVLSLCTLGLLVTLSCEISDRSPITCVNSHYRVRAQSMVCVLT